MTCVLTQILDIALGWGNYMQDLVFNAQLAYSTGRACVSSHVFILSKCLLHVLSGLYLTTSPGTVMGRFIQTIMGSLYLPRYPSLL